MITQKKFINLKRENAPCWYELSWNGLTPAILVKTHRDFLKIVPPLEKAPIVVSFMKEFEFSKFDANIQTGDFGFEGAFKRIKEENDFVVFQVPIPVAKKQTGRVCPECRGKKIDKDFGGKCFFCDGAGKETRIDWQPLYAVSASFTLFFESASLWIGEEKITSCLFPQLILINTITLRDQHGGSLDGTYSIPLADWLRSRHGTEMGCMVEPMVSAYRRLYGKVDELDRHSFWARVENEQGWFNVSCPGDACGLNPADSWGPKLGEGYRFGCHNVDTPMQQLTLLSGLAALCDQARREIKVY